MSKTPYLMVKNRIVKSELEQQKTSKFCYGTAEWSKNSGICSNCKLQDDCGKMKLKNLGH